MERQSYKELYELEDKHWWFVGRRAIIRRILYRYAPQGASLALDIGCGTGLNTVLLKQYARVVVGWEKSPDAITMLKRKHPEITVDQVDFPVGVGSGGRSYDLITLFDVLEHIKNDGKALGVIEELLAPGGIAILTVPAFQFLWTDHDVLMHHFRRYSRRDFQKLINAHTSLQILHLSHFNFLLFIPVAAFRLIKKVLRIKSGSSDLFLLPPKINTLLAYLFGYEGRVVSIMSIPFGVSMVAVLRKRPGKKVSKRL